MQLLRLLATFASAIQNPDKHNIFLVYNSAIISFKNDFVYQ